MRWPYQMAETTGDGAGSGGVSPPASQETTTPPTFGMMDWRAALPENLRSAGVIQQHPTLEGVAKTLVSQGEMLGRAVFLPTEEAGTPEHAKKLAAVYAKLGTPDTADAYTLPEIEGYGLDDTTIAELRAEAHAAHMTQAQLEAMLAVDARRLKRIGNQFEAAAAQSEIKGQQALTAEFGAMTDHMLTLAQHFFSHFGAGAFGGEAGKRAWDAILDAKRPDGSMLRYDPHIITAFAEAAKSLGEGNYLESDYYTPGQNTAETLESRAQELTTKRLSGGMTPQEQQELMTINRQLVAHRERQQRGAPVRRSA